MPFATTSTATCTSLQRHDQIRVLSRRLRIDAIIGHDIPTIPCHRIFQRHPTRRIPQHTPEHPLVCIHIQNSLISSKDLKASCEKIKCPSTIISLSGTTFWGSSPRRKARVPGGGISIACPSRRHSYARLNAPIAQPADGLPSARSRLLAVLTNRGNSCPD